MSIVEGKTSPERIHLVVSTLVPSGTGGVRRSTTVTCVEGYLFAIANAVESPNTPAPIMITVPGTEVCLDDVEFGIDADMSTC